MNNSIQRQLINLPGDSIFAIAVRSGAKEDYEGTVQMIIDQSKDNFSLVEKIIGELLLDDIIVSSHDQLPPFKK